MHMLQNAHEYGTIENMLQLLKTCRKSTRVNCWEALYMQILHKHKILNTEQQTGDINPLYELANTTNILPRNPQPASYYTAYDAHLATAPQHIPTQHDMMPQHIVCKYDLNYEYCNITLTRNKAP